MGERKQKVAYFYDSALPPLDWCAPSNMPPQVRDRACCGYCAGDFGSVYYGSNHPMKPHRLSMTHHLVLAYGLHEHLEVYVSRQAYPLLRCSCEPCGLVTAPGCKQVIGVASGSRTVFMLGEPKNNLQGALIAVASVLSVLFFGI